MAKINGIWVFNGSKISKHTAFFLYEVRFQVNGIDVQKVHIQKNSYGYIGIQINGTETTIYHDYTYGGWVDEAYKTWDFGTTEQEVTDEFYAWVTANATLVEEEPAATVITYGGETIATLEAGQTATIKTADTEVDYDIVVKAGEQKEPSLQEKTATENGDVLPDEGYDGLSKVTVDVAGEVLPVYDGEVIIEGEEISVVFKLQEKTVSENGEVLPDEGYDGLSKVTVNVPIPEPPASYDGKVTITKKVTVFLVPEKTELETPIDGEWIGFYISAGEPIPQPLPDGSILLDWGYCEEEFPPNVHYSYSAATNTWAVIGTDDPFSMFEVAVRDEIGGVPVTTISTGAFMIFAFGIAALQRIRLPKSIVNIESGAFDNVSTFKEIIYDGTMAEWNNVTVADDFNNNGQAITVTCTDGTITIPAYGS